MQVQSIGQKLRKLRENEELLLRQVAADMEMDTALLSRFERDERKPSKEHVLAFARYYNIKPDELLVTWLSDKLASEAINEDFGLKAMQMAEEKVRYFNKNK